MARFGRCFGGIGSLVGLVGLGVWPHEDSAPKLQGALLTQEGRSLQQRFAESGTRIVLGDGSTIDRLKGVQLSVLENRADALELSMGQGKAVFQVVPKGPRRWTVWAKGVAIEVLGTRFSVDQSQEVVRVETLRGRVQVRSSTMTRSLGAGESIALRNIARPQTATIAAPVRQVVPLPEKVPKAQVSAKVLLRRAERARLAGRPQRAIRILNKIIERYPKSVEAPLAAFTLGRLYKSPSRMVSALERALSLGLPSALDEDARARLVEALYKSGDKVRARSAAKDYLSRYPKGRWVEDVRMSDER